MIVPAESECGRANAIGVTIRANAGRWNVAVLLLEDRVGKVGVLVEVLTLK